MYSLFVSSGLYFLWWDLPVHELGHRGWYSFSKNMFSETSAFIDELKRFGLCHDSVPCFSVRGRSHTSLHGWSSSDRHLSPAGRCRKPIHDRSGTSSHRHTSRIQNPGVKITASSLNPPVLQVSDSLRKTDSFLWEFRSLQLSLLLCSFVAVVGGAFFLATAVFIEGDRNRAENYVPAGQRHLTVIWSCCHLIIISILL